MELFADTDLEKNPPDCKVSVGLKSSSRAADACWSREPGEMALPRLVTLVTNWAQRSQNNTMRCQRGTMQTLWIQTKQMVTRARFERATPSFGELLPDLGILVTEQALRAGLQNRWRRL